MSNTIKELGAKFTEWLESTEPKVELAAEVKTEEPTEVALESVLEDGTYELSDGRSIVIEGGNVTELLPAVEEETEEPAMEEEELKADAKKAEEAKLSAHTKEVEDLKAEIVELNKATPLTAAPAKRTPKERINLNADMSFTERLAANHYNNTL